MTFKFTTNLKLQLLKVIVVSKLIKGSRYGNIIRSLDYAICSNYPKSNVFEKVELQDNLNIFIQSNTICFLGIPFFSFGMACHLMFIYSFFLPFFVYLTSVVCFFYERSNWQPCISCECIFVPISFESKATLLWRFPDDVVRNETSRRSLLCSDVNLWWDSLILVKKKYMDCY